MTVDDAPRGQTVDIVVIGAGFGGLCAGIQLRRAGRRDFVILERDVGVGGTWRANRYPGAACDVPSHLYSFSFDPSTRWSRRYASGPEILAYMEGCVARHDLAPHLRFGTTVVEAAYDEVDASWTVHTEAGDVYRARVVITATGGLSRPKVPDIAGLDTFAGPVIHSARWDPTVSLDGARIAVIGTGASAVQIIPRIAEGASHLTVFQRTAQWVLPRRDRAFRPWERAALTCVPGLRWAYRQAIYWWAEVTATAFVRVPALLAWASRRGTAHLEAQVPDGSLRERLTPSYTMGCKRVLLADDYYPVLVRDEVDLVTVPIATVDATGVRTDDGTHHPADVLVLCTGFHAAEDMAPFPILGRGGQDLRELWRPGGEAFLGTVVSGFPSLFVLVGPNTGLGHSSMIFMIECQVRFVVAALRSLDAHDAAAMDVRPEAQARFNGWLRDRMDRTVWVRGGCQSWYLTEDGRNTTLWPSYTFVFAWRTRRPDDDDFVWIGRSSTNREPVAS